MTRPDPHEDDKAPWNEPGAKLLWLVLLAWLTLGCVVAWWFGKSAS